MLYRVIVIFPGQNIYEIIQTLCGTFIAKVIILCYLLWILASAVMKMSMYTIMLQSTLMPSMKAGFIILVMIMLVVYGFSKGAKTLLRFSEFVLLPILFFVLLLIFCSLTKVEYVNLLPWLEEGIEPVLEASVSVFTIGGNLILILFFTKTVENKTSDPPIWKRILLASVTFSSIALIVTVITIGINGAKLTAKLTYPLFTTIKSVSILNSFERLESFITLICMFSDFVSLSIYAVIIMYCLQWVFGKKYTHFYKILLGCLAVGFLLFINIPQYKIDDFYSNVIIYGNVIFQYLFPMIFYALSFIRKPKTSIKTIQ